MNNDQVGHAWYYNTDKTTTMVGTKNFFFSGNTIFSYGSHYPIARKHNAGTLDLFILFTVDGSGFPTTSSYGSTTSRHVSIVRQAIPSSTTIIYVDDPDARTKAEHKANYAAEMARIKSILKLIAAGRPNTRAQNARIVALERIIEGMNIYTRLFKLGKRQLDTATFLEPGALAKIKKQEQAARAKRRAAEKARELKREAETIEKIEVWRRGEWISLPWGLNKCFLRISKDGENVETSKGASLPVKHAQLLFAYVQAVKDGKKAFQKRHFGSFELTRIHSTGNIVIGCHQITYEEMVRINDQLN